MGSRAVILLDTHALIWLMEGDAQLGAEARHLADAALAHEEVSVSAITFWETAMLHQRGRVHLKLPVDAWRHAVLALGVVEIPLSGEIGITAVGLPDFHSDPADRFITATAILHQATLVTADNRILNWSGALSRHNARL
jgi:PIN domain nuclease of toxin-antitoxin system